MNLHKIATVTVWLSIVFASVLTFQLFIAVDESQPAGTQTAFTVNEVTSSTKTAALDALEATARGTGCNIFKVQPDPNNSTQGRILFAFIGNSRDFESHGGYRYPTFSAQNAATRVVAGSTITTEDLRGRYVTDASRGELNTVLVRLERAGIIASDSTVGVIPLLVYSVGQANLAGPFAVMVIALALAISYSVAQHRKIYALKTLHGYRRSSTIGTEIGAATVTFGLGAACVLLAGVPFLALYNGFRQAPRFLSVLVGTFAVLYLVILALVTLAVITLRRRSTVAVLKGEQVAVRNAVLAAAAQVAVLAIVVATASAAMNRVEAVDHTLAVASNWTKSDDLYALRLSVSGTHQDDEKDAPGLAAVITNEERSGRVLFVGNKGAIVGDATAGPTAPEGSESMFVNNEYLRRQTVRDEKGHRIENLPGGKNRFTLLVPSSYQGNTSVLLKEYTNYFKDFACTAGRPDKAFSCAPQGTIIKTAAGQNLFAYNGTDYLPAEQQPNPYLHDPVLAVVSADSELISPMEYLSYVSLGNVLFTNPADLERSLDAQGIAGAFQGIDNAADAVTTSVSLAQRELRMDTVSLTLGWLVLILATMVVVAVYCDRRKRPMFVELIHGYPFASRHRIYLAVSIGLSLLGVGIAAILGHSLAHSRDVAIASAFVAAQVAITLVAIRAYENRFRADFIKRY